MWKVYCRDFWEEAGCLHKATEVQQCLIESMLVRRDKGKAYQALVDWKLMTSKHTRISKYEPGSHFYVLETKFDSYDEAVHHAREHGYTSISMHVVNVNNYIRSGD